jgi:aerobic-type carbon monoxide dehydrogenase small subunit (CoxS/CutS family)
VSEQGAIPLTINGTGMEVRAALFETLLTVIRDQLQLTGAKRGCNQGVCGACTVLADGRPVRSCLSLALDCDDKSIETIEGLADRPIMQTLQRAFIEANAFQCGFCTPGMLVAAFALLSSNRKPTEADVRYALSGNLCRCTGYKKIIEAVLTAGRALRDEVAA